MNDQSGAPSAGGSSLPFSNSVAFSGTGLGELASNADSAQGHFSLAEIWRIIRKWWWLIAAIIVACTLTAVAISLLIEPKYRATTVLEVNPEGVQVVQMGELEGMSIPDREFLTTQAGLIKSRGLAERVVRSLGLADNDQFVDQGIDRARRPAIAADVLQASVGVNPVRDSQLIELTVESSDPALAARAANAYADNFIQSRIERRFEATSYARNFLEQRIATVRERLEDSERQLVTYAQQQGIITLNVDSGTGEGGRSEQSLDAATLVTLNEALAQARTDRITAEARFRQAQTNRSTTEVLGNTTVQSLSAQKAELEAEYQQKLGLFKPDYPPMVQLRSRIQALSEAMRQESQNVTGALQSEFRAAAARESQLQGRVDGLRSELLNLRGRSIQYTILQREVDTNRSLYDALLQRYKEVGVAGGIGTNAVSVVDQARVPLAPFKPNLALNLALGILAGLLLGFGSAFGLEWMDDTIKTPDDLTDKLGLAPLGVIPAVAKDLSVQEQLAEPGSEVSEAYQSVRAALQFSTDHGVPKSLLVTSTRAAEGKSSSALAIATTLAKLGRSVLLIDSDLRKPTFRGIGGGLSSLLSGGEDIQGSIIPTAQKNLSLLPAGRIPPNPAELLGSGRFGTIIARLLPMFDHIIVDAPPVLGLADAPLLSTHVEGTLMIIESGAIRRAAALNAVRRLRSADAHLMGGVLTKFSATKSGYGYGYGYGYGDSYTYQEGDNPKEQIELAKNA